MGCGSSKHGTEVYSASPIPLHSVHAANITPTVAQGDPDEPRDRDGETPLMLAAKGGELEVARELISQGADIEAKDKDGWTTLMLAALNGELEVARELISQGADIEAKKKSGRTVLDHARSWGKDDVVKLLEEAAEKKNSAEAAPSNLAPPLSAAAPANISPTVAQGDPDEPRDEIGQTPLMKAAREGELEVARELISQGADIEAKDKYGRTPLMWAAYYGKLEVARELISQGADIEAKDKDGWTTLMLAALNGELEVARELISQGADIEAKDEDGKTALDHARSGGEDDVVKLLEEAAEKKKSAEKKWKCESCWFEGDPRTKEPSKCSAQSGRCPGGTSRCCNCAVLHEGLLVENYEAEACSMCKARDPLIKAAKSGNAAFATVLLEAGGGMKLDAKDEDGLTALMHGALSGHLDVVSALIGAGADVEAEDSNGDTALLLAEANDHGEVVKELERAEGELHAKRDAERMAEMELLAQQQAEKEAELMAQMELLAQQKAEEEAKRLAEMGVLAREKAEKEAKLAEREAKREALQAAKLEKERLEREAQMEKERLEREAQMEKERLEREARMEKERQEQARLLRVQELVQSLVSGYVESASVLPLAEFEAMLKVIIESSEVAMSPDAGASDGGREDRFSFEPADIITGLYGDAARGLPYRLRVDEDDVNAKLHKNVAIDAMREEVANLGDPVVSEHLAYVLDEEASEKVYPNGIRDRGNVGKTLKDFAAHPNAETANLTTAEAAALRFYTTIAYKVINDPLRDTSSGKPHPLPVTVMLIARGIRKLKAVGANDESAIQTKVLFRGMRNIKASDAFRQSGGTELAPMSTTTEIKTATEYSISDNSLIFYITTENGMQRGADIQFLSAFPAEAEVLYPPLTYLQPTGKMQEVEVEGKRFTVVEVRATLAS